MVQYLQNCKRHEVGQDYSKKHLEDPPCLISGMIFEEKYFSGYILLIDQISLSGCLYFMRYWAVCVVFVC